MGPSSQTMSYWLLSLWSSLWAYNLSALASKKAGWHVSKQHKSFMDFLQSTKLFSFEAATFCSPGDAAVLASTKSLCFRQERRLAFPLLGGQRGAQNPRGPHQPPPFAMELAFPHTPREAPCSSADARETTVGGNPRLAGTQRLPRLCDKPLALSLKPHVFQ